MNSDKKKSNLKLKYKKQVEKVNELFPYQKQ